MNNLPEWVGKVTSAWIGIGTLLILLGSNGIAVPEWLSDVFSETFVNYVIAIIGSVINFAQFVRVIYNRAVGEVQVRVLSVKEKRTFVLNPFKISL